MPMRGSTSFRRSCLSPFLQVTKSFLLGYNIQNSYSLDLKRFSLDCFVTLKHFNYFQGNFPFIGKIKILPYYNLLVGDFKYIIAMMKWVTTIHQLFSIILHLIRVLDVWDSHKSFLSSVNRRVYLDENHPVLGEDLDDCSDVWDCLLKP